MYNYVIYDLNYWLNWSWFLHPVLTVTIRFARCSYKMHLLHKCMSMAFGKTIFTCGSGLLKLLMFCSLLLPERHIVSLLCRPISAYRLRVESAQLNYRRLLSQGGMEAIGISVRPRCKLGVRSWSDNWRPGGSTIVKFAPKNSDLPKGCTSYFFPFRTNFPYRVWLRMWDRRAAWSRIGMQVIKCGAFSVIWNSSIGRSRQGFSQVWLVMQLVQLPLHKH